MRQFFFKPHTLLLSTLTYMHLLKVAKEGLRSNPATAHLSKAEIFFRATQLISIEEGIMVGEYIEKQMGALKYILPTFFWLLIFRVVAQIIF